MKINCPAETFIAAFVGHRRQYYKDMQRNSEQEEDFVTFHQLHYTGSGNCLAQSLPRLLLLVIKHFSGPQENMNDHSAKEAIFFTTLLVLEEYWAY